MQTTRKYITKQGESKMISLTIGISSELELKITNTQKGLQHGNITLGVTDARLHSQVELVNWDIEIAQKEVRAIADAFAFLADLLDKEKKND